MDALTEMVRKLERLEARLARLEAQEGSAPVPLILNGYEQRLLRSPLDGATTIMPTSDLAYWVYLGRVLTAFTVKYVELYVTTGGEGAQTAEVGLFSSPDAPNKANQTISKLTATDTVDDLTSSGIKRNTSAFNYAVPIGTHLWAGLRTAMETKSPTCRALFIEMEQGSLLRTSSAGAITGAGPWTGATVAASTNGICPDLRVTLD